jgi:WD40 repeat protein
MLDLWNISRVTPNIAGVVQSVGFSPDGQLLAAGGGDWNAQGGGSAMLWDITERTRPRRIGPLLTGHEGPISTVAFAPDGHTLATGGGGNRNGDTSNGDVILWDITSREHPSRIGQPLAGHHGPIAEIAFSPDGRTLVTAGGGGVGDRNGTILLWDVTDPPRAHPIGHSFSGHQGTVDAVAFTAAGRMLMSGGYDLGGGNFPTAVLWDMAPLAELRDHASSRACDFAGGGLDEQEWSRYVPNFPYQKTCPS